MATRTLFTSLALALSIAIVACGPRDLPDGTPLDAAPIGDAGPRNDAGPPPPDCLVDGVTRCDGNTVVICVDGAWIDQESCAMECDALLGCVACRLGSGVCTSDGASQRCLPDGSGYELEVCDPVQGSLCDFKSGLCTGPCTRANLSTTYIGCEYYPTVTGNTVEANFEFAVAISNTTSLPAMITIEDGALPAPITLTVPPGNVAVQPLPWVPLLKACGGAEPPCGGPLNQGAFAERGAYHLRSTQPITVYQFNPLDYTDGMTFSSTNDASLLLPTNVWSGNYVVASYAATSTLLFTMPSQLTVTATQDSTIVELTTRADTMDGIGTPAFFAGVPQSIVLNSGDAVQLMAFTGDLTGSLVRADKPVQVIGGHFCARVPDAFYACDHLEESMFPIESLSTKYLVVRTAVPDSPDGREQVVRIIATEPDTTLVYDPPQPALPTLLTEVGSFIHTQQVTADFQVTANHKILVAQYMEGQDAPGSGDTGDPAMALAVATDQFRTGYLFHAPTNYEVNYVNVTAPTGAAIVLDGAAVTGFIAVGGSGYGVAKVELGAGINGNHTMSGDEPFGVSVYGYGRYTSYFYPGGLDLATITIE
ncbi:MAG: hypothetical protein EXR73_01870 [Myxococcales bacterium]|nr:hypothetical protein [Myxococcales bacterium]